jgi:hypothetical protein
MPTETEELALIIDKHMNPRLQPNASRWLRLAEHIIQNWNTPCPATQRDAKAA